MKSKNLKSSKSPLEKSPNSNKKLVENSHKKSSKSKSSKKTKRLLYISGFLMMTGGAGCLAAAFLMPKSTVQRIFNFELLTAQNDSKDHNIYSDLTGLALNSEAEKSAPAYCVQTPNGTDGARPQAGLTEAGVVFEAIAEAGITRFAAIYQNPSSAVIGPIRSLRIYYLEWDTPFDCTIVHAGGSGDALAAVSRGYKDLTEDYSYMYRSTYGGRLWNNLFTTSTDLAKANSDYKFGNSNIKGFARMTPEESEISRIDNLAEEKLVIYEPSNGQTSTLNAPVSNIAIDFGGYATFNVRYQYDPAKNVYLRSYETGAPHDVYTCPSENLGEKNPEDVCTLTQLSPSVVVAMVVRESKASDNYHEDITTVGSGDVYIFENGTAVKGTWKKPSVSDQIKFYDKNGSEIALAPGQTFVEAVPSYGSIGF